MTTLMLNQASQHVQRWLNSIVIEHNFCPFARYARDNDQIQYTEVFETDLAKVLLAVQQACESLDRNSQIGTTLLILPTGWERFDDYLLLLDMAQQSLTHWQYDGVYQLASFHPDYLFDGEAPSSPSHYTNRAPYPILHILREKDITEALLHHDDPQQIPEMNIAKTHQLGCRRLAEQLAACSLDDETHNGN